MSDVLFPEICIGYDFVRKPVFSTNIMTSISGRELRARHYAVPRYEFSLQIPILRESKKELQKIENFFLDRFGSFDSFLFKAPLDNEFESEFVGDGVTTVFQLYKKTGEQKIPITNVEAFGKVLMWSANDQALMWSANDQALMWSNDFYQITSDGRVIFNSPLALGESISITGTFYYRCRFAEDSQEFTLFSYKLWRGQINLVGSFGNKI
ncbi:DUF2460 domain-containing protein [Acinetobacter soli]|uniref:DUF2460 domain-containing protein n=1 Tax=Acinetobacter soli TaxID=487316 RepID=UPI000E6AD4D0|nr:DUF2460 domain-containing protein [Acinetobacter soli]